jgi:hypothetical protein
MPGWKRFLPYVSDGTISSVSVTANLRDTPVSRNMSRLVHGGVVAGMRFVLFEA